MGPGARAVAAFAIGLALFGSGCGGGGDDDDDARQTPLGGGLGIELSTDPSPPLAGKAVTWKLRVENEGVEAIELSFGSSQRAELVLRRAGKEAYRWSSGRFFTTAVEEVRLLPNRTLEIELEGSALKVPKGRYDLIARLTAKPDQEPLRTEIEVK